MCVHFYSAMSIGSFAQDLLCGHHEQAPVPGGFGASAGPNDGFHQALHALTKSYLRVAVGWGCDPSLRRQLDELEMSVQSVPITRRLGFYII